MTEYPRFDHVAIGADTLEQGVAALRARLGVEIPPGGKHPLLSTHNRLSRTGDDSFLEIIAADPDAPAPGRPRWYALDDARQAAELRQAPRPIAWVVGVTDIDAALSAARAAGMDLGRALEVTRGDLRWRLSVRDDGAMPEGATLPALIQWPKGPHPAGRMGDVGLRHQGLRLRHPEPDRLTSWLRALGVDHLARVEAATDGRAAILWDLMTAEGIVVTL